LVFIIKKNKLGWAYRPDRYTENKDTHLARKRPFKRSRKRWVAILKVIIDNSIVNWVYLS
jgi:hypothetical protein